MRSRDMIWHFCSNVHQLLHCKFVRKMFVYPSCVVRYICVQWCCCCSMLVVYVCLLLICGVLVWMDHPNFVLMPYLYWKRSCLRLGPRWRLTLSSRVHGLIVCTWASKFFFKLYKALIFASALTILREKKKMEHKNEGLTLIYWEATHPWG